MSNNQTNLPQSSTFFYPPPQYSSSYHDFKPTFDHNSSNRFSSCPYSMMYANRHFLVSSKIEDHKGYKMFRSDQFKDFVIHYGRTSFRVHKCVLVAASEYFKRMVSGEYQEREECLISLIDDVSVAVFENFLIYLYTGLIDRTILSSEFYGIFQLCDYFGNFEELQMKAGEQMILSLTTENVFQLFPQILKFLAVISSSTASSGGVTAFPAVSSNASTGNDSEAVLVHGINNSNKPFLESEIVANPHFEFLKSQFIQFLVRHSYELAGKGFPFQELGEDVLRKIFLTQKPEDLRQQEINPNHHYKCSYSTPSYYTNGYPSQYLSPTPPPPLVQSTHYPPVYHFPSASASHHSNNNNNNNGYPHPLHQLNHHHYLHGHGHGSHHSHHNNNHNNSLLSSSSAHHAIPPPPPPYHFPDDNNTVMSDENSMHFGEDEEEEEE
jgi:hypothetical protein